MTRTANGATAQFALPELFLTAFGIITLLLVNKAGLVGNLAFFCVLTAMVAHSPEMAFRALTLCFLGLVSNQAIVLKTPIWTIGRLVIPALCFARFLFDLAKLRQSLFRPRYLGALAAFIVVAGILSVMTNYYVHIALLKLVNFGMGSFAMLLGARIIAVRRSDLTPWFVAMVLAVVLLGLATIPLGIGYNFRGSEGRSQGLFNGPFYHSNCMGPMSSLMALLMASVVVFGPYRNRWLCGSLGLCLLYMMFLTKSRTGLGSFIVGFLSIVFLTFMLKRRHLIQLRMRISRSALVSCLLLGGILAFGYNVASNQALTRAAITFAQKGKESEALSVDDVLASRQGIIDYMWANFLASPWIGIGFEVSTHPYFQQNATLFNAPIEKGFLPVAVLEETGIIGTTFFVIFLLAFAVSLALELNVPGLSLLFAFLAVNCGEAMFFSLGGHGGYGWLMMTAGIMLGQRCIVRVQPRERRLDQPRTLAPAIPHLQPSFNG